MNGPVFWEVVSEPGGLTGIALPSPDEHFKAVLLDGNTNGDVFLVIGYGFEGVETTETTIGKVDDGPVQLLTKSGRWMLAEARVYMELDLPDIGKLVATIAGDIANRVGDVGTAAEAYLLTG